MSERSWTPLAPAPVPPSEGSAAVLGSTVYLAGPAGFWAYDRPSDTWTQLPPAPDPTGQLIAAGDRLVMVKTTQETGVKPEHVYDPQDKSWSPLPRDPLAPAFDRVMVWDGEQLVLLAKPLPPPRIDDDDSPPSFVHAARLDVTRLVWAQVPQVDEVIGFGFAYAWTGQRIVSPYVFDYSLAGDNQGGATEPTGGYLDVKSGDWTRLPKPPAAGSAFVTALSPSWITAGEGLVLDVADNRWLPLPRAPGQAAEALTGAWVGDQLIAFGGGDSTSSSLTSDAWAWRAIP